MYSSDHYRCTDFSKQLVFGWKSYSKFLGYPASCCHSYYSRARIYRVYTVSIFFIDGQLKSEENSSSLFLDLQQPNHLSKRKWKIKNFQLFSLLHNTVQWCYRHPLRSDLNLDNSLASAWIHLRKRWLLWLRGSHREQQRGYNLNKKWKEGGTALMEPEWSKSMYDQ